MSKQDFYTVLGVEKGAGEDDIKSAYRKMAMKYHPDRNPGDHKSEEKFKEATEAYEVLKDPAKRRQYDQVGHSAFAQGGGQQGAHAGFGGAGFDINDALRAFMRDFGAGGAGGSGGFEDFFGGGGRANRGEDLRIRLALTLEEIASGITKTLRVKRLGACGSCRGSGAAPGTTRSTCRQCGGAGRVRSVTRTFIGTIQQVTTCPGCRGEGQVVASKCQSCTGSGRAQEQVEVEVTIPAGVSSGNYLTVDGKGNAAQGGGEPGDLQVLIEESEHEFFTRSGDDIVYQLAIPFPTAAMGGKEKVPTLRGDAAIKIPAGVQSGKIIRIKGEGIPHLRSYGKGDQLVLITVWTPARLNPEEKRLFEKLAESENVSPPKTDKSFFEKLRDSLRG